nr:hypothetical protein [Tanacetum cinerariifolium]
MVAHAFNVKNSMSMLVQKSQNRKMRRLQDDVKRLCLVDDLKKLKITFMLEVNFVCLLNLAFIGVLVSFFQLCPYEWLVLLATSEEYAENSSAYVNISVTNYSHPQIDALMRQRLQLEDQIREYMALNEQHQQQLEALTHTSVALLEKKKIAIYKEQQQQLEALKHKCMDLKEQRNQQHEALRMKFVALGNSMKLSSGKT